MERDQIKMPRKRNLENKGLPERWRFTRNAYYYQVPRGLEYLWGGKQTFRLGKTLPEAYRAWAERLDLQKMDNRIGALLDRYALEIIPTKKPTTQARYLQLIPRLRAVFGEMPAAHFKAVDAYKYIDVRSRKSDYIDPHGKKRVSGGLSTARKEIALLSHVFTMAIKWGVLDKHPFKGELELDTPKPRARYVEDWEIIECLSLEPKKFGRKKGSVLLVQAYIKFKLLTGLRCIDILRIPRAALKDDGIHVYVSKTERPVIFEWTTELRAVVEEIKMACPVDIAPSLFCTATGGSYLNPKTDKHSGFDSMWKRFINRVLLETKVEEGFTEHDLRAKCASDAESLERARQLLAHADSRTTKRFYRRKPERVRPAK